MSAFIQEVVAGILIGALYGLVSSGLTLVFGITRVVNFAHGDFVTIGIYAAIFFSIHFNIAPLYLIIPTGIVMFLVGGLLYRLVLYRMMTHGHLSANDAQNSQMVITFAISTIIANAILAGFGPQPEVAKPSLSSTYDVAGIYVSEAQLVSFAISIFVFALLFLLMDRTRTGKAIKATVDDRDMSEIVGINTHRIYTLTFGIGILLAGITGVVLATFYTATPTIGEGFLIVAFVTVVLGGLGSIKGALIAGIFVGVVQQLTATYIGLNLQDAGIFVIFILVLIVRPSGFFGQRVNA